jgi:hypothetical protein
MYHVISGGLTQGHIKSLRGPRPVFSAGPQSTEICGGVWCVLDALLFM